jgi:hypothetical protein
MRDSGAKGGDGRAVMPITLRASADAEQNADVGADFV